MTSNGRIPGESHSLTVGNRTRIMLQGSFTYFKNHNEVDRDLQNDKVAMRTLNLKRPNYTTHSGYLGQILEIHRNHGDEFSN